MRKFTTTEKNRMNSTAESTFNDSCDIHTYSGQYSNGEMISSFTTTSGVDCGFDYRPQYRDERGQLVIIEADAILRLDTDQSIKVRDEITVRETRFIVDGVNVGRTCKVVALKDFNPSG
jgi:hypothetical protein